MKYLYFLIFATISYSRAKVIGEIDEADEAALSKSKNGKFVELLNLLRMSENGQNVSYQGGQMISID